MWQNWNSNGRANLKKKDTYLYPAVFSYEDGYEIAVTFPDLPGCATCGKDEGEALSAAKEALGGHLYCLELDGDALPAATPLKDVHCDDCEKAVLIDVYMPVVRMAENNKSVNRTVTIPAWLNAAAVEKGVNFSRALQSAIIDQFHLRG